MKTLDPKEKKTRRAPPKRASTKPVQKRTVKRVAEQPVAPDVFVSGKGLSSDEKRRIILAHAAMRETHDPVQIVSMWAGVTATALMVLFGWWWAVKPEIAKTYNNELRPAVSDLGSSLKNVTSQMKEAQEVLSETWKIKDATADSGVSSSTGTPVVDTLQQLMQENAASGTQDGTKRDIFNKPIGSDATQQANGENNNTNKQ